MTVAHYLQTRLSLCFPMTSSGEYEYCLAVRLLYRCRHHSGPPLTLFRDLIQ